MSKLRKKFITVLAVLLCAMLALSTAILFIPKKTATAARSGSWTVIDEIYSDSEKRFNYDKLQELYKAIAGSGATYDDVANLVQDGNAVTSNNIRGKNSGNNVSVKFGGIKWDIVYLTEDKSNNVILDLWVSSDDSTIENSAYAMHEKDYCGDTGVTNLNNVSYPSNMYATSIIRVNSLNADGRYSESTTQLATKVGQKSSNRYAKFTMTRLADSLTQFIVQPKDIAYQATENIAVVSSAFQYRFPNDAYDNVGTTVGEGNWYTKKIIYWGKGADEYAYDAWKNDYLWLPSLAETGNNSSDIGIWETDDNLRISAQNTWLRSGKFNYNDKAYYMSTSGEHAYCTTKSNVNAVRPALHLNLTAAEEDSKKVLFGTTDAPAVYKTATLEHEYDNEYAVIEIPDWDRLQQIGTVTDWSYLEDTNKFKARDTVKQNGDYETGKYEITVQPTGVYYWADATTENEKQEERKYAIHIKPATLSVTGMQNPYEGVPVSGSLLQTGYTISSSKLGTNITPTIKYYKVDPPNVQGAVRPPDNEFEEDDGTFTASQESTYRVYYNVEVDHHTIYRGQYDVIVSGTDSAKLVYNGSGYTSVYGETNAQLLEDDDALKAELESNIKVQKDGADDPTRFNAVWGKLEAVVCTKDGANYKPAEKNGAGHYDVGTYYVDLRYMQGESQSISLSWDGDLPSFEITPRSITIQVIADEDGELSSIYGEGHAAMKFELISGTLADGEYLNGGNNGEYKLAFGDFLVHEEDDEENKTPLNTYTPVGTYKVTADTSKITNYTVKFETVHYDYAVKERTITLKVTDETVEYGVDLNTYKFKNPTPASGSLSFANGNVFSDVITKDKITYTLWKDDRQVALSNSVAVGEYDLYVAVTAENYKFEYVYGKLTVTKADFPMSGVELKNAGFVYDGKPHAAEISGTLPEGVSVTYEYYLGGEKIDGVPTEKGLYTVYAKFTLADPDNYNGIPDRVAYLKIASSQEELDKGFPEENPDPDGNNGSEETPTPAPEPSPEPSVDLESKKDAAKEELDKAAQAKKEAIDSDPNLTDEQKQAAKDKVDKELAAGKDAIDKATDENGINSAESAAKTNIGNISIDPIGGNTDEGGSFPWWILAVAAGVLLLLIALVIVIVKRRQTADGDEDFYDEDYDFDEEDYEEDFGDDF